MIATIYKTWLGNLTIHISSKAQYSTAALIAIFYQKIPISEVLNVLSKGCVPNSEHAVVGTLLSGGGIARVLTTASLFIFTLGLGGILSHSGILNVALTPIFNTLNNVKRLIPTTLAITYVNCLNWGLKQFCLFCRWTSNATHLQSVRIR